MLKLFKRERKSNTLTNREHKQMLKIMKKWALKEGYDWDGDHTSVYFNLADERVELVSWRCHDTPSKREV